MEDMAVNSCYSGHLLIQSLYPISLHVACIVLVRCHTGGQVMYVAMPYFVFMEAMVSWLINGENISYVWNPCCLLHFTVLWARVRMGHACPSFARNPLMPLCLICSSLCFAIHLMGCIDVIAPCKIFREPMCLLKSL